MLLVLNVNLCLQICFVIVPVPFVRIVLAFLLLLIIIYLINILMEQTILNPKLLLTVIMLLSLWLIAAIISINALWRRTNKLRDYCDVLYSRVNLLDKCQKENHDLMIKIVATAQDVNENNAEIIKAKAMARLIKIIYKHQAVLDIRQTQEYIAETLGNKRAAQKLVASILKAISLLEENPMMGISMEARFEKNFYTFFCSRQAFGFL